MVDPKLRENPFFYTGKRPDDGSLGGIFAIALILWYLTFTFPLTFGWITSPLTYLVLIAGIIFTIS